jgi:hypothetical protein
MTATGSICTVSFERRHHANNKPDRSAPRRFVERDGLRGRQRGFLGRDDGRTGIDVDGCTDIDVAGGTFDHRSLERERDVSGFVR